MKKNLLILMWALAPVALLAYHFGPGQVGIAREEAKISIRAALDYEAGEQWPQAIDAYNEALAALPQTETAKRQQLQLARANARIYVGELPEAMLEMEHLLDETVKGSDSDLQDKVRSSLASAQYYTGWLMRLELAEKKEWMEPLEKARQNFRLLAEQTDKTGVEASEDHQKNLEAVVRLARMDLSEVQALPLPKKCQGNKNVCSKCNGQKKSNKPKNLKKKEDARGASVGKRPDGKGS
ncbi:MAG: tetratricopeptide (TPR) repeat protein [Limisphaerales bacterium]|jgi:tetratricopeptide (TPR) repeat protein